MKTADTDFDQLINAAKLKLAQKPARNPNLHRDRSRAHTPMGRPASGLMGHPLPSNLATFFARPGISDSHELANSKFLIEPSPTETNPSAGNKNPQSLGNQRWRYQGKTYKEEPIGKR
jgi:hypothetical protein